MKACDDGFGIRGFFVLEDDPFALFWGCEAESRSIFGNLNFNGLIASSCRGGDFLRGKGDRFHVFIEKGDEEFSILLYHFTMHSFIGAEFKNAAFVRAEFDISMTEGKAGSQGEEGSK